MARMHVMERSNIQVVMDGLHTMLEKRLSVSSLAPCPIEFTAAYISMCMTQSCGKCTPCRIGLDVLHDQMSRILENRANEKTLDVIERIARTIYLSADCAIGYEVGAMALTAIQGFRDDFEHHIKHHACGFTQSDLVPCVSGCPAGVDIPGYIALVEEGRYTDAIRLIRKDNPLPLICGMVCEHPCEMHCRRGMVDDPINIRGLKRYAAEHMEGDYRPTIAPSTGKKVAIVGGGPAGLSAAYYLALMGHHPVIFEQSKQLGGMLRYGIPSYRLPRKDLDAEIQWLLDCGIETHTDTRITLELPKLRRDFDAVYLAFGAHNARRVGLEGEDAEGVISAVEMLHACGDGDMPDFTGESVAVIGSGNVAMDVSRTAIRLGASRVTIVYRRRVDDMTAQDDEIIGARAEGCHMLVLHQPVQILTENGHVTGLVVQPQMPGEVVNGRPRVASVNDRTRTIKCTRVIVAIGQAIDSGDFIKLGMATDRGKIVTDKDGAVGGFDGVFCGGDCQSGPATVIRAINAGKVAAGNIDNYLGFDHKISVDVDLPPVHFKGKISCARCDLKSRRSDKRIKDFDNIEVGLTYEEAHQEASRCLRCDHFGFGAFRGGRNTQW